MFFKQLVRCPYLIDSDELQLFLRPKNKEVERELTYLPKLSIQKILEKLIPFYSIMGDVENDALQPINLAINSFCVQCKTNLSFLEKFREYVDQQEKSFDTSWASNSKLNNFFFAYEKDVLSDYLLSLNN